MMLWTALVVIGIALLNFLMLPAITRPEVLAKLAASGGAFGATVAAGVYDPTWYNYLHLPAQNIAGSWGILTFSLVAAYVFGREYREGTVRIMLTTPVRREFFVLAKLVVVAVWVFALTLLSAVLMVVVVSALNVSGFAWTYVAASFTDSLKVSVMLYLTLPAVACFATLGRGYLPPMLFALAMMMLGSALVSTRVSHLFPWNLPLHLVGASYIPLPLGGLTLGSIAVSVGVFLAGTAILVWQVDHSDNAR